MKKLLTIITLSLICNISVAAWQLDQKKSKLYFSSIKNQTIVEAHTFKELSGEIDNNGNAKLIIDMKSLDTRIPIRDERMLKFLFNTEKYPETIIKTQVDLTKITSLKAGENYQTQIDFDLIFKGEIYKLYALLTVKKLKNDYIEVSNTQPLVLTAANLQVIPELELLRTLAGLKGIEHVVPVNLELGFKEKF